MNANYPAQTRDARPAFLLLAATALLMAAWFSANGLSHLASQDFDLKITTRDASLAGPAFQALRPPEPPASARQARQPEATPTPPTIAGSSGPVLSPVLQRVATPPASH